MGLLVDTIRGVTEGYNKSKSLEVQNRLLVQKLQKLKEQNINPNSNRAYFVEGAMWICKNGFYGGYIWFPQFISYKYIKK